MKSCAPKISVVVPIYNTEATLRRCVDSVLKQSFRDFEIVLVDDGSPDRAGEIADEYAQKHSCIVVAHKRNAGLAEARRSGIDAASGEYVVPLDSDDDLPNNALEILFSRCESEKLDLCYGAFMRVTGDERWLHTHCFTGVMTGDEFRTRALSVGNCYGSCYCMSRRDVWHDDVFPPADRRLPSEDVIINIRLAKYLKRVGVYNDYVYNYYINPNSLSVAGTLWAQELWEDFFVELRSYLKKENLLDNSLERIVRVREVDHFCFYVKNIDTSSQWYKRVMAYDMRGYPRKVRVMHALLSYPRVLRWCVKANRLMKKVLKVR